MIILFSVFSVCFAWDQSELEIFDLVEEINQNFYDLLGVPQVGQLQPSALDIIIHRGYAIMLRVVEITKCSLFLLKINKMRVIKDSVRINSWIYHILFSLNLSTL